MELTLLKAFDDELETEWNSLVEASTANFPFMRYGYQKLWWQSKGGGEWPDAELCLILGRQDGALAGIAPLFVAPEQDGQRSLMLVGSHEVSDYLDLVAREADLQAFIETLAPFVHAHCAGAARWALYNLQEDSPSLPHLQRELPGAAVEVLQPAPYITLPGDWDTYLAGIDKKQRHEIKRKIRRAEAFESPVRWYRVESAGELDGAIQDFLDLMAKGSEKAAFLSEEMKPFMSDVIRFAYNEGILYLAFLEVGGKRAAAKLFFDYDNKLWGYNSGYDRAFLELSPGWVLQGYLLRWANEHGRRELDFMRGDEVYKYRFGAVDRHVVRLTAPLQAGA